MIIDKRRLLETSAMEDRPKKNDLTETHRSGLLDACVVIAENLRIFIGASVAGAVLGLSLAAFQSNTYQSTSLLRFSEADGAAMRSADVLRPVIEELQIPEDRPLDTLMRDLNKRINLLYRKKDGLLELSTEGKTAEAAQLLNIKVLQTFLQFSLPKGRSRENIDEQIRIASGTLEELHSAALRVGMNLSNVKPGTEAEAMTRSYITMIEQRDARQKLLFELKTSLKKAGAEVVVQNPTLPTDPVKPFGSSGIPCALMGMFVFGFLALLYVWLHAQWAAFYEDPLQLSKLQRIKNVFNVKTDG